MIEVLLGLFPFVLILVLMVFFRRPASESLFAGAVSTFLIMLLYWRMDGAFMAAASVKGVFIGVEIVLILLGALVLYEVIKRAGCLECIRANLSYRNDYAVSVLIIAWGFGALIEGIAGFGVPAALAAPLLVGAGFTPVAAVVLALIANSAPVSFGALGTPVLVGIASVTDAIVPVALWSAAGHALMGLVIPFVLVCVAAVFKGEKWYRGFRMWKLALASGLLFSVPYLLVAVFLGPVFPSIAAGASVLMGLFLIRRMRIDVRAWLPYLIAGGLLLVARIFKTPLSKVMVSTGNLFFTDVSAGFSVLTSPGVVLLVAAAISSFVFSGSIRPFNSSFVVVLRRATGVFVAIASAGVIVQLVLLSGQNATGMGSLSNVIAGVLAILPPVVYALVAPFIGGLGAFISGSNTVSNLLFGPFQFATATLLGLPTVLILALQNIGAAAGNMICPQNLVAACTTVGIEGRESEVLRKTLTPSLLYMVVIGALGLIALTYLF